MSQWQPGWAGPVVAVLPQQLDKELIAGGVVIDVDWPVKDDEYPTDDYGYQRIYFGPGPQLMDGRTALQYARSRHGMSDFARAGRQQKVILSLKQM